MIEMSDLCYLRKPRVFITNTRLQRTVSFYLLLRVTVLDK